MMFLNSTRRIHILKCPYGSSNVYPKTKGQIIGLFVVGLHKCQVSNFGINECHFGT